MINTNYTDDEIQQKNVIDDFAKYVAHNGIECEIMTQHKQQGNPLFAFLFGGRLSDYYRCKLGEERSLLQNEEYSYQHGITYTANNTVHSYTSSSNQFQHGYDFTQTEYFHGDGVLNSMKSKLDHERTSLQLLQEEHYGLLTDSQKHLNDESRETNKEKVVKCMMIVDIYRLFQVKKRCQDNSIDFDSMEKCMQAILVNCTKDNICSGKNWVLENCTKVNNYYPLCMYLLAKVSISTIFNERLHIVYFINDLLHHCKRKNSVNLLEALESVMVPIYSLCVLLADEDGKTKLNKVLSLWESNSYIKKELLDSMRQNHVNPIFYLEHWFDNEINIMKRGEDDGDFRDVFLPNEDTISRYQSDAKMKLSNIEANHNQLKYELKIKEEAIQISIYELERDIKAYESRKLHESSVQNDYNCFQENQMIINAEFPFQMPDISRPPPGFSMMDISHCESLSEVNTAIIPTMLPEDEFNVVQEKPNIPYWRLPAALMVAHIRLSQFEYKAIDTNDIKMPQLRPPSKRLIDISNTFYQLPSHDRPRDTEGWERLGLHDFLKAKEKAKTGDLTDDFVSSLHLDKDEEDDYDYGGYDDDNTEMDYRTYDDTSDFRRKFPPPGTLNNDYRYHTSLQHFGPLPSNYSPRTNNQRSLLGSPWENNYSGKHFSHNIDVGPSRSSFSYNNSSSNRSQHSQSGTPRLGPQKIVPLMSLGLPTNMKRHGNARSKRSTFRRNSDDDSYNDRQRSKRRYASRSGSRSKSRSSSHSRSRSRSASTYSRSRSRSYSRSRSNSKSRSRSRSSRSSRSSGKRPYKGGFIAKKRSKSRSGSRSRSLSRSPKRPNHDSNFNPSSLMQNLPDRRIWSGMRSELINPDVDPQVRNEDPFSRFRQQKSSGYTEWMKERVVRRSFEEDTMDNF